MDKVKKLLESNTLTNIIALIAICVSLFSYFYTKEVDTRVENMQKAEHSPQFNIQREDYDEFYEFNGNRYGGGGCIYTLLNVGNESIRNVTAIVTQVLSAEVNNGSEISDHQYIISTGIGEKNPQYDYEHQKFVFNSPFSNEKEILACSEIGHAMSLDEGVNVFLKIHTYVEISYFDVYGDKHVTCYRIEGNNLQETDNAAWLISASETKTLPLVKGYKVIATDLSSYIREELSK